MPAVVAVVLALSITQTLIAQGLVNFANTPTTPVYVQHTFPDTSNTIMTAGDSFAPYYFALLIGQDISGYSFTGLYATNTGVNGLFSGGVVAVPGWAPGTATNFLIAGWSGQFGHDFSPLWFGGIHPAVFGVAGAGRNGVAGNGSTIPVLNLFDGGPGTIPPGVFQLQNYFVPEPSAAALIVVAAGVSLLFRGSQNARLGSSPHKTLRGQAAKAMSCRWSNLAPVPNRRTRFPLGSLGKF